MDLSWGEFMRTIVVVLFFITIAVWIVLQITQARTKNPDIKARFAERIDYIPSRMSPPAFLGFDSLKDWLDDPANAATRRAYAFPVLFPLDFVFLIFLGLFLGLASLAVSNQLAPLRSIPAWTWWVFPSLYIICDSLEDTILLALFTEKLRLEPVSYFIVRTLTKAKIATVSIAIGQIGFLAALWGLLRFHATEQ
jgi:hypothetical protein